MFGSKNIKEKCIISESKVLLRLYAMVGLQDDCCECNSKDATIMHPLRVMGVICVKMCWYTEVQSDTTSYLKRGMPCGTQGCSGVGLLLPTPETRCSGQSCKDTALVM